MSITLGPTQTVAQKDLVSTSSNASDGACSVSGFGVTAVGDSSIRLSVTDPTTGETGQLLSLQTIQPSVGEKPQAKRLPREAGIRMEPITESASGTDDESASDTHDDHDSKDQWEYTRIVDRWEDSHGNEWVKLQWANSLVLEKDFKGLAKVRAKYGTRKTNRGLWEDPHGRELVEIVWKDSWISAKDVKGLPEALAEYKKRKLNRRRRKTINGRKRTAH